MYQRNMILTEGLFPIREADGIVIIWLGLVVENMALNPFSVANEGSYSG